MNVDLEVQKKELGLKGNMNEGEGSDEEEDTYGEPNDKFDDDK